MIAWILGGIILFFVVLLASFVLVPVAIVVGAGLYYWIKVHKPVEKLREQQRRTDTIQKEIAALAPVEEEFENRLRAEGITDERLVDVAFSLFELEGLSPPKQPTSLTDTIAAARYRDKMLKYSENARPEHFRKFCQLLLGIIRPLQTAPDSGGLFQSRVARTPQEIENLKFEFVDADDEQLFKDVRRTLNKNYNGQDDTMPTRSTSKNVAWDYLKDTPLLELEYIEKSVSLHDRMTHTYILGASGSGKTNLIEHIIAADIEEAESCVVVIDSQVQLIPKLAGLDLTFDDVTYITPEWSLALNLFDVGYADLKNSGIEGEQIINKTVGLISFVMEGMMGTELTNPQKTIFQYAIQLVISIPGGNIFTFMDLLADDGHLLFENQINSFDENTQRFFRKDFGALEYKRSREAIRWRLDSLLTNPTFRRLFSATENKINMYEELKNKKLVLIDTNKPMLDDEASAFFGRLFIAMIVQASHRRFASRGTSYRPVYLYVDEAHEYFDNKIAEMLEQARKADIGLVVAHQSLSQARGRPGSQHCGSPDGQHRHKDCFNRVSQRRGRNGRKHENNRRDDPGYAAIQLCCGATIKVRIQRQSR